MIWIDMDGVLADLVGRVLEVHNQTTGDDLKETDITYYEELEEKVPNLFSIMSMASFFQSLPIYEGAKKLVDITFHSTTQWAFLTSCPLDIPTALYDKEKWIDLNIGYGATHLVTTWYKPAIISPGDLIIEDNPRAIEACRKKGIDYLCIKRPWNTEIEDGVTLAEATCAVEAWLSGYK